MKTSQKEPMVIGQAEEVSFPELSLDVVPARIDTGARTSSIWGRGTLESDGRLAVILFGESSSLHTGTVLHFTEYSTTVVASSNGHAQERYKVRMLVRLGGRRIRAWFTLADRATQVYPVLIGRNVLRGKFIVDVKQGKVLHEEEQQRTAELRAAIEKNKENA